MKTNVCVIWRFGCFLLIAVFFFQPLWADADRSENANRIENPICVQSSDDGLVVVYNDFKQMAFIAPQIFSENGQFSPFEIKGNTPSSPQWIARLPGGGKVSLESKVKILKSGIEIQYVLIPKQTLKDTSIIVCANFPYADWCGNNFQLGSTSGIIPKDMSDGASIAYVYTNHFEIGPSHALDGLLLHISAKKIGLNLRSSRAYDGSLQLYFVPKESFNRHWKFVAGEEKVFDFQIKFNRQVVDLSEELASLEPKRSVLKPRELTPDQLSWGEKQLKQMLRDRPAMVPYVREGDDLWKWMVRQFAGEYVEGGIFWDPRNPQTLWDAWFYASGIGKEARDSDEENHKKASIQVTKNFYIDKNYQWDKPKTGPTLWYETFYEIFNLMLSKPGYRLDVLARKGKESKEIYILKSMLAERQTGLATGEFFKNVWIPHCKNLSVPYEDEYFEHFYGKGICVQTREDVFKDNFHPDDFHYKDFAKQYDAQTGVND